MAKNCSMWSKCSSKAPAGDEGVVDVVDEEVQVAKKAVHEPLESLDIFNNNGM
jgi:hypothetical protein